MAEENPSILSHVSIGTNDFERSCAFYDRVLATLGCKRLMQHPGAVAYGRQYPEFWVGTPFGFVAASRPQVHAFYDAAVAAGASADGAPGPREEYGAPYYGCFVRDPDGHKIEAAYWDASLQS
jgi:catechol 2,3-dioxygenase-like lactoylglutathione lyase family enzyme